MTGFKTIEGVQNTVKWGNCYGFLSYAHSVLPTSEFIDEMSNEANYGIFYSLIRDETVSSQIRYEIECGLQSIKDFNKRDHRRQNFPSMRIQTLAIERSRLYHGVTPTYGPLPPYESVYRGQPVMGSIALEVKSLYEEFDYHLPGINIEPPDSLGSELGFMNHLFMGKAKAMREGDQRRIIYYLDAESCFLSEHLLLWAPAFCSEVIYCSNLNLYQGISKLTKAIILIHAELLEI